MDEFARLRQDNYSEHRSEDWDGVWREHTRLAQALLGDAFDDPKCQSILTAAALRWAGPGERLLELIHSVGQSAYLDRYLADAIRSHPEVGDQVDEILRIEAVREETRSALVRLAAAADRRPFARSMVRGELQSGDRKRAEAALSYTASAGLCGLRDDVAALADRHISMRPEAEDALCDLDRADGRCFVSPLGHPVALVQSMFYGDPARMGRGNSGGIGTLLRDLGTMVGDEVGGVATLVPYNRRTADYPLVAVEQIGSHHSIVRIPVGLEEDSSYGFLVGHHDIRRAFARALVSHGITPEIVHVRFLDDASLAVAREAQSLGAPLVVTVTPDPHRTLCDTGGRLKSLSTDQAWEHLNKILIGDELISRGRGLLAIGRETVMRELLPYYPQLEDTRGRVMDGIDEGVRLAPEPVDLDVDRLLTRGAPRHSLDEDQVNRPALLTVGRLAPIKNQVALVGAWARSIWRTHNLVVIGGDQTSPSPVERDILKQISECVDGLPHLKGRFCHLPASPNAVVRHFQTHFGERNLHPHFDVYVCPSIKEEFGLSILEAMAAGMVVCAPLKGGARTYIRHGINGFLIDTRDRGALENELAATVLGKHISPDQLTAIRENAIGTIRQHYSIETVAHRFADFYRRVTDE
jgi:glycosyltransferase involved in cell wall biosynthesis